MIGTVLGNYRLRMEIGRGGMGAVYVGDHLHLARQVALKVLLPELCTDPEAVRRLFQEARATSLIRHPGIVEIFDCDAPRPDTAFLVMELLAGESLASYARRLNTLPPSAPAIRLMAQIAEAVGAAHGRGIFHRDLKPDNVFLLGQASPEQVKVLDFGIAKLTTASGNTSHTRTGALVGTPLYMSPEQCRGRGTVDHRTDIYSFGCLLFEIWCGRPPFAYEGAGELVAAHLSEPAPDPRTLAPNLPPELAGLIVECLAKDPDRRPQTMDRVVARLRDAAGAAPDEPLPPLRVRDFTSEVPWQARTEPPRTPANVVVATPITGPGGTLALPETASKPASKPSETTLGQAAVERPPAGSRGRPAVLAAVLLLAAGAVAGGVWMMRRTPAEPATSAAPPESTGMKTILVEIEGAPPGVRLKVDGAEANSPVELPMGTEQHVFEFTAPGFELQRLRFDAQRSRVVTLAMRPLPKPEPEAAPKPEPPPEKTARTGTHGARQRHEGEDKRKPKRPQPQESFKRFDDI